MEETDKKNVGHIRTFEALYTAHWQPLVRRLLARFGAGPPDPEDIAQAACLKFAELPDRQQIDNPKAFLYRIASNLIVDHHRSPKNVLATEHDILVAEKYENSDVSNPENVLMNRQEADIVTAVIRALPERDRAFVLMNRLEGLTYTDIARQAGMSRAGVQKIIIRALEKCTHAVKQASQ